VDYALETTAFHWIEHHHNPLKWHHTSYSCLFSNFGMHDMSKMFTTKIGLVSLCRLSQRMSMGIPSTMNPNTLWLSLKGEFLMKEFSRERFKWEENSTWWGYWNWAKQRSTRKCSGLPDNCIHGSHTYNMLYYRTSKFLFNQFGRNQIARFENKILLDNSNRQYTKKRWWDLTSSYGLF
jgi:hypothetical protein